MLFITIMTKCLIQQKRKNIYVNSHRSWAPQGRRLGDERLEFLVLLVDCNNRFIKEHKPSNHIRARIKSQV